MLVYIHVSIVVIGFELIDRNTDLRDRGVVRIGNVSK